MYTPDLTAGYGLMTDLYQLTMAAGYYCAAQETRATFELSIRGMPPRRSYLVAAGLGPAVEYLLNLRFHREEIDYLATLPVFKHVPKAFFEYLATLRFTGNVWAVPEGTVVFDREPLMQIEAPIVEAQIVETFLLSVVQYETLVASKASRVVQAARGKGVVDFGSRRAHGPEAGIHAARASYIGGCLGTSNVRAGKLFGIPVYGTMAHSWVLTFESELEAFERFSDLFPEATFLLVDTYDVEQGILNAVRFGRRLKGIRLDSGDLLQWSLTARKLLDAAGLEAALIMASGDLNEYRIDELLRRGAPIDLFGVGTDLVTSRDEPALGAIYKLVETRSRGRARPCAKLSEGKVTYPGRKQIWRCRDAKGCYRKDVVAALEEAPPEDAEGLLVPILVEGKLAGPLPTVSEARNRCLEEVLRLPARYRTVRRTAPYPVNMSPGLTRFSRTGGKGDSSPSCSS